MLMLLQIAFIVRVTIFLSFDTIAEPIRARVIGESLFRHNLITCLSCLGFYVSVFFGVLYGAVSFSVIDGAVVVAVSSAILSAVQVVRSEA